MKVRCLSSMCLNLTIFSIILSGCSSGIEMTRPMCALTGAMVGGAAGWGIHEAGDKDTDDKEALVVGITAPAGAVVGYLLCPPKEPPQKIQPEPEQPKPAQMSKIEVPIEPACSKDPDGDGVKGDLEPGCPDKCRNTPKGVLVDLDGCPKLGQTLLTLHGVNFKLDSAELTSEAKTKLSAAIKSLEDNPGVRVKIAGHTDSIGKEKHNMRLSNRRANAVMRYLTQNGISPDRMEAVGYGETRPLVPNTTEANHERNRRVEFVVIGK